MDATIRWIARVFFSAPVAAVLVACGDGGSSIEPTTRLIGTITYRERVALPPESTVEIHLEDTAGGSPVATQTVRVVEDRQVPLPFTLEFDRAALQPEHRYVVRAVIRSPDGAVLFATPADQRPLDNPNTTGRIELELAAADSGRDLR